MLTYEADTLREMVNLRDGTISREVFVNEDIYQQELEQIFARAWLFVGDGSAPSFEEYVGDLDIYLRPLLQGDDGRDNGVELIGGVHKWHMPSNWKFPSTSFQGDGAHGSITHRSINVAAIGPQGDADEGDRHGVRSKWPAQHLEVAMPGLGHSGHFNIKEPGEPYTETWQTMPWIEDY